MLIKDSCVKNQTSCSLLKKLNKDNSNSNQLLPHGEKIPNLKNFECH